VQSSERSERENFFEKVRGRLFNANVCLSNLIFLSPLVFPPTFMKIMLLICMFLPPSRFFQDAGYVHASMEWTPLGRWKTGQLTIRSISAAS